jgi:transcriptional regulator with XRE-family HTH domain
MGGGSRLEVGFGLAVRAARAGVGISQEELAHRSGLHRTFVSQIERGLKSPSLASMERIAQGVETPLDVLIRDAQVRVLGDEA